MLSQITSALKRLDAKPSSPQHMTHSFPLEAIAYYLALGPRATVPQLVIAPTQEDCLRFVEALKFFAPSKSAYLLPNYSPTPYSGVQLPLKQVHSRLQWLFHSVNGSSDCVFVAPIQGVLQKTLPTEIFIDQFLEFKIGDELPDDFFNRLHQMGYVSVPMVEDRGTFARRGGLVDIFSPHMENPVRLELFGNEIESLRHFNSSTQRTITQEDTFSLIPAREALLEESSRLRVSEFLFKSTDPEFKIIAEHLRRGEYCDNLEYFLPLFYPSLAEPISYFNRPPRVWFAEDLAIESSFQSYFSDLESLCTKSKHPSKPSEFYKPYLEFKSEVETSIYMNKLEILETAEQFSEKSLSLPSKKILPPKIKKFDQQINSLIEILQKYRKDSKIVIAVRSAGQWKRISSYLKNLELNCNYSDDPLASLLSVPVGEVLLAERQFNQNLYLPSEHLLILSYENFFGKAFNRKTQTNASARGKHLSFGEIKEGDYVVHSLHGVCQFIGMTTMSVSGVEAEFLTLNFKGNDKLFLPIYRIHQIYKHSSERVEPTVDKLGGNKWQSVKTKTKKRLREIANDLIELYAQRKKSRRPKYTVDNKDILDFFNGFPFEETQDQLAAIEDLVNDLNKDEPMDRLVCGDVGFGKTEVAMRAAFIVASQQKQVAILAPTTVLTMQHMRTFKKRFADWPLRIEVINRLIPSSKVKEILSALKTGSVDIIIGTHRLLSKDVEYSNLGLLVCDEEQKFGVVHKEKIRKFKVAVDTLALSATPIPRTLNMSLLGIRDLSLIHTAPVNRLETRTFICKHNDEVIRQAVETEVQRGGQVFFLHNRVQSIYTLSDELRRLVPKVRIGVAHGQMKESELESMMIAFFNHDIDLLVCSTIIESGMDIPNANTILINNSENFGLSQLYQLRGRVGRSGRRAYCYLLTSPTKALTPIAKDRLKVIQENTALGSGMQIAQYDLELRGAGTLLGEEQSGLIDSVGYEFYMDLLEETIQEAKGESRPPNIEPEINLKIKAFIPHSYIPSIRMRLSYYRALTQIQSESDIDHIEEELKDQFGKLPEEALNLLGIMLIRRLCLELGVRDISSGKDSLILSFTEHTPLPIQKVIELTNQVNKKYSLAPSDRLKIRLYDITWPKVYDEVSLLLKYCPLR